LVFKLLFTAQSKFEQEPNHGIDARLKFA